MFSHPVGAVRSAVQMIVFVMPLALLAAPAGAQSTGMIKGKVVDAQQQPVEGATIVIEGVGGLARKHETKTNKRGDFVQIGLQVGNYRVTAEKDGLSQAQELRVRLGEPQMLAFTLTPGAAAGGGGGISKEEAAKLEKLRVLLDTGVAANQAGRYDEAIAAFNEAVVLRPACATCYYSIGYAQGRKKDFAAAEAALKKAIEINPQYAEAYAELATLYNNQKRFDDAATMSAEATRLAGGAEGGGNPEIMFNQGVILWNQGKIAEAKQLFESVIKANPKHADAHYQLGMSLLNEGKMPEAAAAFETYLELAPDGKFAEQAKGILSQIKK